MLNSEIYIIFFPSVTFFFLYAAEAIVWDCTGRILTHGKDIFFARIQQLVVKIK